MTTATLDDYAPPSSTPTSVKQRELPPELRGWNWGAFFLNALWGLAHRTPIALLTLVPVVGLVMPFVLGAKGNAWAWRNGKWDSVAEFQASQRRWRTAGLAVFGVLVVLLAVAFTVVTGMLKSHPVTVDAQSRVQSDAVMLEVLGQPMEFGLVTGNVQVGAGSGQAEVTFSVSGPKGKGRVLARATQNLDAWRLTELHVQLENGRRFHWPNL